MQTKNFFKWKERILFPTQIFLCKYIIKYNFKYCITYFNAIKFRLHLNLFRLTVKRINHRQVTIENILARVILSQFLHGGYRIDRKKIRLVVKSYSNGIIRQNVYFVPCMRTWGQSLWALKACGYRLKCKRAGTI